MPRIRNKTASVNWRGYHGPVILPICVRSPAVSGRHFLRTLDALAERADTVRVLLCDSLDRYNVGEAQAMGAADQWLAVNLPHIRERFGPVSVRRWDEVRADPTFARRHAVLTALYEGNPEVRAVIDRVVDYYLTAKAERDGRTGIPFKEAQERQNSGRYMIEEYAGTAVYKDWYPGLPEAYWGVYVGEVDVFNRLNTVDPSVDLSLPVTLPVSPNQLPAPVAGDMPRLAAA